MHRLRVVLLALLVLVVPTFALGGEEDPSGPATLSVNAALEGCGLANATIVCQIDAGWTALEEADYYTVSVTRADGSVIDLGQTEGTSRSIFVPYVGAGTYSVQVAAWGTPAGDEDPEMLAREEAKSTGKVTRNAATTADPSGTGPAGDGRDTLEASEPADDPGAVDEPPVVEGPTCDETPEDEEDAEDASSTGRAVAETAGAETAPADEEAESDQPDSEPSCP
jgi:hypothetical protein